MMYKSAASTNSCLSCLQDGPYLRRWPVMAFLAVVPSCLRGATNCWLEEAIQSKSVSCISDTRTGQLCSTFLYSRLLSGLC